MKMYELFIHGKQGNDIAPFVAKSDSAAEALNGWREYLQQHVDVCARLAEQLVGFDIDIESDNNFIFLQPKDKAAEQMLESLVEDENFRLCRFSDESDEDGADD